MERMIRLKEVVEITGYSRATIYRLMDLGMFPMKVKLGLRAVAWKKSDVENWLSSRK